jgi:hypothetical protein
MLHIIRMGKTDPKYAMAAVKAFDALGLRFYGKPDVSDDEKEANTSHGVKIVLITKPELMHNDPIEFEGQLREPTVPNFAVDPKALPPAEIRHAEIVSVTTYKPEDELKEGKQPEEDSTFVSQEWTRG